MQYFSLSEMVFHKTQVLKFIKHSKSTQFQTKLMPGQPSKAINTNLHYGKIRTEHAR
jgi:hypothetical protein